MDLTPENKLFIDGLNHESLLGRWRSAPVGDPWFQGETGKYWSKRLTESRDADPARHTAASKALG